MKTSLPYILISGLVLFGLFGCEDDPIEQVNEAIVDEAIDVADKPEVDVLEGEASYYADSLNGKQTASGDFYDKNSFSAAHRSLPFETKVKVTYLETGRSVVVSVNDRGPYIEGRIISISGAAAKEIGLTDAGHGKIRMEVVEP